MPDSSSRWIHVQLTQTRLTGRLLLESDLFPQTEDDASSRIDRYQSLQFMSSNRPMNVYSYHGLFSCVACWPSFIWTIRDWSSLAWLVSQVNSFIVTVCLCSLCYATAPRGRSFHAASMLIAASRSGIKKYICIPTREIVRTAIMLN